MSNELVILIIGAAIGLASTLLIELIKYWLERKRAKDLQEKDNLKTKESNLRDFLSLKENSQRYPAWLKLVETRNYIQKVKKPTPPRKNIFGIFFLRPLHKEEISNIQTAPIFEGRQSQENFLEKFILTQTQIIGRQMDCEIHLTDPYISRLHAMVRFEEGDYVVYDLGSVSGTYVNGEKVSSNGKRLSNENRLAIGESILVFESSTKANHFELPTVKTEIEQLQDQEINAISKAPTQELKMRKKNK